jgi:hypothetical protein
MYGMSARIISHETWLYLRGIVGIDGWANFAIALKAYADCKPTTSSKDAVYPNAIYLMMMGYALEDLAKCIIAYKAYNAGITDVIPFEERLKEFEFTRKDGQKRKLGTHNLDDLYLAEDIGFEVSTAEIDHLKLISIYALWKGRYPVPLDIAKMPSSPEPSFEDLSKTATSVYDRAMAEVERLRSSRS